MNETCKISAVVPAYNVERFVGDAISSLLTQTKPFHEIIVIDDGSTDSTPAILARITSPLVRQIRTENRGLGPARNLGLSQCSGDFVYFFDSDDVLMPTFVDTVSQTISKHSADLVFFSGEAFSDGVANRFFPDYQRKTHAVFASGVDATRSLIDEENFFPSACLYVSKVKTWKAHDINFPKGYHEDEAVILKVACSSGNTVVLPDVLFRRRVRASSIMTSSKTRSHVFGYKTALLENAEFIYQNRERLASIDVQLGKRIRQLSQGYLATRRTVEGFPDPLLVAQILAKLGYRPNTKLLLHMVLPRVAYNAANMLRHKRGSNDRTL
jgi:glycosyltransferase involved in cell wall biosynthesis